MSRGRNDVVPTNCYVTAMEDAAMTAPLARDTLNLRIKAAERGLIDRAAALTGKSRTAFILDATRKAAEAALLDRTLFDVGQDAQAAFLARLDAPPRPSARLQKSLTTPAPWDAG